MARPVFATNRPARNETVSASINELFRICRQDFVTAPNIDIATAYIDPDGFALIAEELERAPHVRLLLGAEPDGRLSAETPPADLAERVASGQSAVRDLMGFTYESSARARQFTNWLASVTENGMPRVEVRRLTRGFLHGKAFIVRHDNSPGLLAGSSNFTAAGLSRNRELNLGLSEPLHIAFVNEWYDELWAEAEPYDLAAVYAARWQAHAPWTVFLRMLYELYGDSSDKAENLTTALRLTGFQLDGVARARRILEELGGVLVCDEVGLGKTFIAGEIIHRASKEERQNVLCIVPAALKAATWEPFLKEYDFSRRVDVLSFDELRLQAENPDMQLKFEQYALVVIDEAHNLRNTGTDRAKAVELLLGGRYRKKVVLMTATPVNNSLKDLYSLVSYFIRNDAIFAYLGIPSIHEYIKQAMQRDPETLSPEHLFDLLDQVAVRRTRRFIQKNYTGDMIMAPDGQERAIEFPTPMLSRVEYRLSEAGLRLLDAVIYAVEDDEAMAGLPLRERMLARSNDPRRLSMARYVPSIYKRENSVELRQVSASALLQSALLKRLESSMTALVNTLRRMKASHEVFLDALRRGVVISGRELQDFAAGDLDIEDLLELLDSDQAPDTLSPALEYDTDALESRIVLDIELMDTLIALAYEAITAGDPKKDALVKILENILQAASRPSADGVPAGDRRKVIVFSAYSDTIEDIHKAIVEEAARPGSPIALYQGRIPDPVFGSRAGANQNERAETLAGFVPRSSGRRDQEGRPIDEDLFDILFTTDVLSEGVNLQQCGRIVNLDLPWNPMRLVQRHGRVDRLFSPHREIMLHCFFPAEQFDRLLGLEETLQRKVAYANAAIGIGQVLPEQYSDPSVEVTLHDVRIQIKQIFDEDSQLFVARGGGAALSGEEYRRQLSRALVDSRQTSMVRNLPFGSGSGFINSRAGMPGWVFCVKIGSHPRPWFRYVVADRETWQPLVRADGRVWVVEDTLSSLMAADPGQPETPYAVPDAAVENVFEAWAAARRDIEASWNKLTDPANLAAELPKAVRDAMEFVFRHGAILGAGQDTLLRRLQARWEKPVLDGLRRIVQDQTVDIPIRIRELKNFAEDNALEPPPPPVPLPQLKPDDIRLVCWMAVGVQG